MAGNSDGGWFKATRGPDPFEVITANPYAFVLAYIIAARSRWNDGFNRHGLEMGEAFLGDFTEYGMTERNYRTAKGQLSKWGFATFKTTNKGTIGKLIDSRLFSAITKATDGQTDSQPTVNRRTADGQPTTNKEHIRTEEPKEGEGNPPCKKLSDSDRISFEKELGRVTTELNGRTPADATGPNTRKRIEALIARQVELRQKLGVTA